LDRAGSGAGGGGIFFVEGVGLGAATIFGFDETSDLKEEIELVRGRVTDCLTGEPDSLPLPSPNGSFSGRWGPLLRAVSVAFIALAASVNADVADL